MTFLIPFFFFILGLVVGSFLNVVIFRFNTSKVLKGRSICVSCHHKLCWYELIPLISFCALKGRCRNCQTKISRTYFLVELITGFIFLGLFLKFSAQGGSAPGGQDFYFWFNPAFFIIYAYYALAFSILMVIAFYDLKHKIIPDKLSFSLGLLSFVGLFIFSEYNFYLHFPTLGQFLTGPLLALPFAFLWFISKGSWMGLGDAKLIIGLGWLVGISQAFSGITIAFWSGALLGIFLIIFSGKYKMKSEIPFAPFLIFSTILAFLFELHIFLIF